MGVLEWLCGVASAANGCVSAVICQNQRGSHVMSKGGHAELRGKQQNDGI